jgi:DNA replication protein DnaC
VECGFSVAFYRLEELLHAMRKDADVPPTRLKGKKYMKAGVVIIDEVGFETFTREEANLFFRLVSYPFLDRPWRSWRSRPRWRGSE